MQQSQRSVTNRSNVVFASGARTASANSDDVANPGCAGGDIIIDVTAAGVAPSVVFTVKGKDEASGKYYTILASAAITGTGTTVLRIHPGIIAAANTAANACIPAVFRVEAVAGNTDSLTYSVGANLVR